MFSITTLDMSFSKLRAQVLKRDPVTLRVTLAMATIPKMDGGVIAGPKGTTLVINFCHLATLRFFLIRCFDFCMLSFRADFVF